MREFLGDQTDALERAGTDWALNHSYKLDMGGVKGMHNFNKRDEHNQRHRRRNMKFPM